jgi:hypothetical protein
MLLWGVEKEKPHEHERAQDNSARDARYPLISEFPKPTLNGPAKDSERHSHQRRRRLRTCPGKRGRYRPGEAAPVNGICEVVHLEHRRTHEILILARDPFPACRCCHTAVRFQVLVPLWHAREDHDLSTPGATVQ